MSDFDAQISSGAIDDGKPQRQVTPVPVVIKRNTVRSSKDIVSDILSSDAYQSNKESLDAIIADDDLTTHINDLSTTIHDIEEFEEAIAGNAGGVRRKAQQDIAETISFATSIALRLPTIDPSLIVRVGKLKRSYEVLFEEAAVELIKSPGLTPFKKYNIFIEDTQAKKYSVEQLTAKIAFIDKVLSSAANSLTNSMATELNEAATASETIKDESPILGVSKKEVKIFSSLAKGEELDSTKIAELKRIKAIYDCERNWRTFNNLARVQEGLETFLEREAKHGIREREYVPNPTGRELMLPTPTDDTYLLVRNQDGTISEDLFKLPKLADYSNPPMFSLRILFSQRDQTSNNYADACAKDRQDFNNAIVVHNGIVTNGVDIPSSCSHARVMPYKNISELQPVERNNIVTSIANNKYVGVFNYKDRPLNLLGLIVGTALTGSGLYMGLGLLGTTALVSVAVIPPIRRTIGKALGATTKFFGGFVGKLVRGVLITAIAIVGVGHYITSGKSTKYMWESVKGAWRKTTTHYKPVQFNQTGSEKLEDTPVRPSYTAPLYVPSTPAANAPTNQGQNTDEKLDSGSQKSNVEKLDNTNLHNKSQPSKSNEKLDSSADDKLGLNKERLTPAQKLLQRGKMPVSSRQNNGNELI